MKSKKTIAEKYIERKIDLPNRLFYRIFLIYARLDAWSCHTKYYYHFDKKAMKGKQVILIADHDSYNVPVYVMGGYPFARLNVVRAYQDLFQKIMFPLLMKMGIIAKRQFVTDLRAVRQMVQVVRMGGSLCFFPEGINSFTGANYPINPSTVDLLKTFGVTVVLCKNYGAHCIQPFYKAPTMSKGRQEMHYEILFTPEELKEKSCDELYQKLKERIRYRDFEWAAEHGYTYHRRGETNAFGADNLVYLCPKCKKEFTLKVEGDDICCTFCGNRIRMDGSYALHPAEEDSVSPYRNLDDWYKAQRRKMREDIKDPDFSLSYDCELRHLHYDALYWDQFYVAGEGTLTIDHEGIHYKGTRLGQQVDLDFDIHSIPTFLLIRKFPDLYYLDRQSCNVLNWYNEMYYFRPKQDLKRMIQYQLAVEELHNLVDPVWNQYSRDVYDEDEEPKPHEDQQPLETTGSHL